MAALKKARSKKVEIEFAPDAWKLFERAVKVVVKSPPQPKVKAKKKKIRRAIKG